jgi:hypothetical protein
MQPADYRLVRCRVTAGVMMPIKRQVVPKTTDESFSLWLYGQRKSAERISADLFRATPCLVCSQGDENNDEFSLFTVDPVVLDRYLPLLSVEQLSIVYSLLVEDWLSYRTALRLHYQHYKRQLIRLVAKHKHRQH